jgi:hypothetical protein
MKALLVVVSLTAIGCQNAVVLSSDGKMQIGRCDTFAPITCVSELCPEGFVALKDTARFYGDTIVRCLARDGGAQ